MERFRAKAEASFLAERLCLVFYSCLLSTQELQLHDIQKERSCWCSIQADLIRAVKIPRMTCNTKGPSFALRTYNDSLDN